MSAQLVAQSPCLWFFEASPVMVGLWHWVYSIIHLPVIKHSLWEKIVVHWLQIIYLLKWWLNEKSPINGHLNGKLIVLKVVFFHKGKLSIAIFDHRRLYIESLSIYTIFLGQRENGTYLNRQHRPYIVVEPCINQQPITIYQLYPLISSWFDG